jgi:hypothetical protein
LAVKVLLGNILPFWRPEALLYLNLRMLLWFTPFGNTNH